VTVHYIAVSSMANTSVQWRGINKLSKKLGKMVAMNEVKEIVKLNASELEKNMQRNASFKGHYENGKFVKPTGATKRSIGTEVIDNGLTAKTAPHTEYAPYLEYGTRYMSAQPFVKPAFNVQKKKFRSDLNKLFK